MKRLLFLLLGIFLVGSAAYSGIDYSTSSGNTVFNDGRYVLKAGDTMTGTLTISNNYSLEMGTGNSPGLEYDSTQAAMLLFFHPNNILVLMERAGKTIDFGHTAQVNPTLFLQSSNEAITSQWLSFAHEQTQAAIRSGSEEIVVIPAAGFITVIGDATTEADNLTTNDDLLVTGSLEADGMLYADGGLTTGVMEFAEDAGAVTAMDFDVSATPTAGEEMSLAFAVDSEWQLKLYAEADSAGGIQNEKIIAYTTIESTGGVFYSDVADTTTTEGFEFRANNLLTQEAAYIMSLYNGPTTDEAAVMFFEGDVYGLGADFRGIRIPSFEGTPDFLVAAGNPSGTPTLYIGDAIASNAIEISASLVSVKADTTTVEVESKNPILIDCGTIEGNHNSAGLDITTGLQGRVRLIPKTGYCSVIGDATIAGSHNLGTNDDLIVSGSLEVDGIAYFDGDVVVAGNITGSGSFGEMNIIDNSTEESIGTHNVWEVVTWFQTGLVNNVTYASNSLEVVTATDYLVAWDLSASSRVDDKDFEFGISVNDAISEKTVRKQCYGTSEEAEVLAGSGIIALAAGDIVKLEVRNVTDAFNVTILDATVRIENK